MWGHRAESRPTASGSGMPHLTSGGVSVAPKASLGLCQRAGKAEARGTPWFYARRASLVCSIPGLPLAHLRSHADSAGEAPQGAIRSHPEQQDGGHEVWGEQRPRPNRPVLAGDWHFSSSSSDRLPPQQKLILEHYNDNIKWLLGAGFSDL